MKILGKTNQKKKKSNIIQVCSPIPKLYSYIASFFLDLYFQMDGQKLNHIVQLIWFEDQMLHTQTEHAGNMPLT